MRSEPTSQRHEQLFAAIYPVRTYRRSNIHGANIAMVLGTAFGAARGGLLADYPHESFVPFILHLTVVRQL